MTVEHHHGMGQIITHACGHEQIHYISGFTSQQERKTRWLETTKCRNCFVAIKQAEQMEAAVRDGAAIAHLNLPLLAGSDRQITWATAIRAGRLGALVAGPVTGEGQSWETCVLVTDAKWWIDHRDLTGSEFLANAKRYTVAFNASVDGNLNTCLPQTA